MASAYPFPVRPAAGRGDASPHEPKFMASPCPRENSDGIRNERAHHIAGSRRAVPAMVPGGYLGHYRIDSLLGAGGMGEIYRATDVRLGRRVAVKVLPASVANRPDRLARLQDEARTASALSHPNILTVHDIGEFGSVAYIVTELIEGETLRDTLRWGAFPIKALLDIAVQLCEALATAHDAGIVHRDLSPASVMVSSTGLVKLLDFGLATSETPSDDCGSATTRTAEAPAASRGEIAGTAGYMSPEQVRGESVDFRSDQFALGSLLYEMATGTPAFRRRSRIETLCAVLTDEPKPMEKIQPGIPPALRWIVERCLAKRPQQRYRSTRDLLDELREIRSRLASPRPPAEAASTKKTGSVVAVLVAFSVSLLFLGARAGGGSRRLGRWRY
jgi:eukaryotic-like serine/threonine-protein kinase